ncbi:hypothetical protein [Achromobacter ruhlandii]|uniref:hypothetical protein n=1 Tax=Achromobacter ruhlandii TaxID=72557 RepID=UPI003B9BE53C
MATVVGMRSLLDQGEHRAYQIGACHGKRLYLRKIVRIMARVSETFNKTVDLNWHDKLISNL